MASQNTPISPPEPQQPASATSPDRQFIGESTGECLHPPPDHTPPAAGEEATEVAARRQRLLALQQELAHLKKTPSMQLLARQRIPRLERLVKALLDTARIKEASNLTYLEHRSGEERKRDRLPKEKAQSPPLEDDLDGCTHRIMGSLA